jgi:hypothetical protein
VITSIVAGLAIAAAPVGAESPPVNYIAHEWGTFTSVQGADGIQMYWNPLLTTDLPKFVYDLARARIGLADVAKSGTVARQRMETPVIYFHSDQVFNVDIDVTFPKGYVTEWYPRGLRPSRGMSAKPAVSWREVTVIPRDSLEAKELEAKLRKENGGSHYYAAREAEADYVSVANPDGAPEVEKFLFYRGVGNFFAPLQVTIPDARSADLRLENTGDENLQSLFVVRVGEGFMTITPIGNLPARSTMTASVSDPVPVEEGRTKLGDMLRESLTRAGLTSTEAVAMVKTWDDSWFGERGVRVLYLLPQTWADAVLPLTLNPMPNQLVRVFLGRAEVITPQMELALIQEIDRGKSNDAAIRAESIKNIRSLGLGRFLEPAFRRIAQLRPDDRDFSTRGWELLNAANQPTPTLTRR